MTHSTHTSNLQPMRPLVAWGVRAALVVGLMAAWVGISGAGPAVQAEEFKVAFVDLGTLFDSYTKTKASDKRLEKKGRKKEAEFERRVTELKQLRSKLELLSDEARDAKLREIEDKSEELQRFRTRTARNLSRERDQIAKGLFKDIERALGSFAEEKGYSIILNSRSLLYGRQVYDVTDEVVAYLNSGSRKRR